jgi:hypothetical protein
MALLDLGGAPSERRSTNHELPLVPFIDFLLCIVAFLLVTAVWSQMARLEANARVPGDPGDGPPPQHAPELHVDMRAADRFVLEWRQGDTVLARDEVPRSRIRGPADAVRFPALSDAVSRLWKSGGAHRSAADPVRDRAVLHSGNAVSFEEIAAALDAIEVPLRPRVGTDNAAMTPLSPAFKVVFAVD